METNADIKAPFEPLASGLQNPTPKDSSGMMICVYLDVRVTPHDA